MKKTLSYRDKLLELGRIYNISEIQNYIKRKKNLTTQQIEHILKKNNVSVRIVKGAYKENSLIALQDPEDIECAFFSYAADMILKPLTAQRSFFVVVKAAVVVTNIGKRRNIIYKT